MKFICSICIVLAASLLPVRGAEESDSQVEARKIALDLAGAFSNDGFKLRDGHWSGPVKKGEQAVVAVNLYAGNQYWFSVGASPSAKKFNVQLFDENGQPITVETFEDDDMAAAGYAPTISGQYFVAISPVDADASTYCLVYSYK
jgi:hypothetical protein